MWNLPTCRVCSLRLTCSQAAHHGTGTTSNLCSFPSHACKSEHGHGAGELPRKWYWGRSRAEVVRAKAGQCYSVREPLSLGGGHDASAVERVLELIKAEVKHGSGEGGRCGYDALLAADDEELGPGVTKGHGQHLLDWEAGGVCWDEAAHITS